ncbi:MAG: hypothetical protein EZS28_019328 [Streblomastix strix]|uniref:Uncharacterized protein n=1 Tax=Streblomastix strix TaxID=222440 RepID=A0A5J4VR37_9EUKA|nr:MAG: hypothetical protein EZS28_019328 [Streblomastix strix]
MLIQIKAFDNQLQIPDCGYPELQLYPTVFVETDLSIPLNPGDSGGFIPELNCYQNQNYNYYCLCLVFGVILPSIFP